MVFDPDTQNAILAGFGAVITEADNVTREDLLLYGPQGGPAAEDLLRFLPPDQQALARARMAVRRGDANAETLIDALPADVRTSPGLVFERAIALRDRGRERRRPRPDAPTARGVALTGGGRAALASWLAGRRGAQASVISAGAYAAAAHSGLTTGAPAAEVANSTPGWIALT